MPKNRQDCESTSGRVRVFGIALFLVATACGGSTAGDGGATTATAPPTTASTTTSTAVTLPANTTATTTATTAGPVPTPLLVATAWIDAYEAGDVDTFQALVHPDATAKCEGCAYQRAETPYFSQVGESTADVADSRLLALANGSLNAECATDGSVVSCETLRTSDFGFVTADGDPDRQWDVTYEFTVENGLVTRRLIINNGGTPFDFGIVADYERWLQENHPDAHGDLFAFGTILLTTLEQFELHQGLVPEFWASR